MQDKKINTKKSLEFLYTNNENSEREIKESIPFTIATKKLKYLGINLPKEMKELYTENYKMLVKEIKDDINRWRDIPYSWLGRINIVKITILPNTIYSFKYHGIFHGTRKKKKKITVHLKTEKTLNGQSSLEKKEWSWRNEPS